MNSVTTCVRTDQHDILVIRENGDDEISEYQISLFLAKLRGINIDKLQRWHPKKTILIPILITMIEANGNEDFQLPTNLEILLEFYYLCCHLEYKLGKTQSWLAVTKGLETKLYDMEKVIQWFLMDDNMSYLPMNTVILDYVKQHPQLLDHCHPILWKKLVLYLFALDTNQETKLDPKLDSKFSKPIPDLHFIVDSVGRPQVCWLNVQECL